jgi:hypothetical protein
VSTGLAAKPRASANPESLLQRLVFLPILDRCPDEESENQEDGRGGGDREDYLFTRVHGVSLRRPRGFVGECPSLRSSSGIGGRAGRHLLSGLKEDCADGRRKSSEHGPDEERGVVAAVERGEWAVA